MRLDSDSGQDQVGSREEMHSVHHLPRVLTKLMLQRSCQRGTGSFPVTFFLTSIWDLETSTFLCLLPDLPVKNVSPIEGRGLTDWIYCCASSIHPQICSTYSCPHRRWWPHCTFSCCGPVTNLCPHGLQHARLLCPPLSPRVRSNSCPLSQWCYLTSSSSVTPFTICLQSFPASGSFSMSQLFSCNFQMLRYKNAGSFLTSHLSPSFISQIHQRIYKLHLQKMSIIWPLLPTFMTCFGSSHCHLLTILLK